MTDLEQRPIRGPDTNSGNVSLLLLLHTVVYDIIEKQSYAEKHMWRPRDMSDDDGEEACQKLKPLFLFDEGSLLLLTTRRSRAG